MSVLTDDHTTRTLLALLAAATLGLACAHAQETEPTVETQGHATPPKDRPHEAARAPAPGASPPVDRPSDQASAGPSSGARQENEVPVTSSPAGLLKPGATGRIQDKLTDAGLLPKQHEQGILDGPTLEALRRFQRDHDLPATGVPDDATVRTLGLSPDDVFKSAR